MSNLDEFPDEDAETTPEGGNWRANSSPEFQPPEANEGRMVYQSPPPLEGFSGAIVAGLLESPLGKAVTRGMATFHAHGYGYNPVTGTAYPVEEVSGEEFSLSEALDEAVQKEEISQEDRGYFNDVKDIYDFRETLDMVRGENWLRASNFAWYERLTGGIAAMTMDPIGRTIFMGTNLPIAWKPLKMAAEGLLTMGATGEIQYGLSKTVTQEEVLDEALGGAILGGIMGGVTSPCTRATFKKWGKALGEYFRDPDPSGIVEVKKGGLFRKAYKAGKGFVSEKIVEPTVNFINSSPYLAALRFKDEKVRDIFHSLYRNNQIITDEMRAGKTYGLSAEGQTAIKTREWSVVKDQCNDLMTRAIAKGYEPDEFNLELSRHLRNTLVKGNGETAEFQYMGDAEVMPEVKAAGEKITRYFHDLLNEAEQYGVIPSNYENAEGVKANAPAVTKTEAAMSREEFLKSKDKWDESTLTAWGHLTRMYDKEKVLAHKAELEELLIKANLKKNPTLTEKQVEELAANQYRHIMGTDFSDRYSVAGFDFRATIGGNFVRERHVNVVDEALEKFLVNNPFEIGDNLVRKLAGATQLNRAARECEYKNWKELLDGVNKSRSSFGMEAGATKKYDGETAAIMENLMGAADLIMGNYSGKGDNPKLATWVNAIKWWNRVTQLGGVLISSIPDVATVILRHGLKRTSSRALNELFSKDKIFSRQAMEKVMAAGESMMNMGRVIDETYVRRGGGSGKWEKRFHRASGLPAWNDFWKRVASSLHYDSIIEASIGNSKKDQLFLRQNRISAPMGEKIAELFNSGAGYEENGLKFLPLDRIADKDLKNALWEALQTAADETIVTPGAGDVPRVLRGNIGSALLQYKSFITAFHTNVFIPILRQKESRGFLGQAIASSLTLGIVTEDLKERFAGRKPDYKSLDYWKQALWRSGVLSVFPDMIDAAEWMVKREDISTVSPTVQRVNDILKVGSTVLKKKRKISEQKMRKMVGLIPFGNLFYLKTFLGDPAIRWESKRSGRKLAKNYNFLGLE